MRNLEREMSKLEHKKPFLRYLTLALAGAGAIILYNPDENEVPKSEPIVITDTIRTTDTVYAKPDTVFAASELELDDRYSMILTDSSSWHPYQASTDLIDTVLSMTHNLNQKEKAAKLFDWVSTKGYIKNDETYKNADGTFRTGGGVCGELAFMYISAARIAGLDAHYVSVSKDMDGSDVLHGCAGVTIDDKLMLVDPTYKILDAKHKEYKVINDAEAHRRFTQWSRTP